MNKKLFGIGGILALFTIAACNNGENTSATDSTTVSTGTTEAGTTSTSTTSGRSTTFQVDPSASYVDLRTGKSVKLKVDTVTKYVVDEVTNQPIMYFINPATNDTFDRSGRVVSHALVRGTNGDYTVDESRLTTSNSDNSGTNMSSGDTTTSDNSASGGTTGNTKTKIKDDKFKQKTDTSVLKVKDGKIKAKTHPADQ
jgi:hypothetical protein